ncbi:hypothetical protein [Succinimonas sp.]|uniref:hypothetical protein n=1 Tax=Succinimonas sp. TaxID=1936151 RepID=UPI00386EAE30
MTFFFSSFFMYVFQAVTHTKYRRAISAHEHKSKLHSFFSVNENLISLKIGEASRAGAFDWNSNYLQPLKDIIEQGFV